MSSTTAAAAAKGETPAAKRKNGSVVTTDVPSKKSKKEKKKPSFSTATDAKGSKKTTDNNNNNSDFSMLKLEDIGSKIELLCKRVPAIPEGNFIIGSINDDGTPENENGKTKPSEPIIDETATREWAAQLQVVLEEFNLYICCVGTATYKWGTERSGAADQNLTLLLSEISSSQEQISTAVTPRLTNLLAPVVDLVIEKTITYKQETTTTTTTATATINPQQQQQENAKTPTTMLAEVKENHFTRKLVDPAFLSLCHKILARNAPLLRRVVLSNFHKILAAIKDFLKAQKNDTQHSRSFTY